MNDLDRKAKVVAALINVFIIAPIIALFILIAKVWVVVTVLRGMGVLP